MPHYPGHYKRYGYTNLDTSALENVYEHSKASTRNYGLAEARQRAALQAEADKLRRTYRIFRMSGMPVSDWSKSLQSQIGQIQPDQTRQQIETKSQRDYISDAIRRLKPKNDQQLSNLLDALGAGMEWFSKAKEMAKNYYYGPEQTLMGFNKETGETEYRVGPERSPEMMALRGKFFKKDVFTAMKTDKNAAMRNQAIAQYHAAGLTNVEDGREWLQDKQLNDKESGIKWYDKDVMSDFWGMMDKFTHPGEAYTIWFIENGKIRAKPVHRGRRDEAEVKKIDPNAVGSKDALLAAHGKTNAHSDLVNRVMNMVVTDESTGEITSAPVSDMLQAYEEGAPNVVSFDQLGDRKKAIEAIYQAPMAEMSYKIKVMEHGDKLRAKLSKDQMDILLPGLKEVIRMSDIVAPGDPSSYPENQEESVDRWVKTLMRNIEGSGKFNSEALTAVEKYAREVLTERRTARTHGLNVEKIESELFTENLRQKKVVLDIGKLLNEKLTYQQAARAEGIINKLFDEYRDNSGAFGPMVELGGAPPPSLRTAIERAFVLGGIQYRKEDWAALGTKIADYEKALAVDKDRTLVNLNRMATLEKTGLEISEIERKTDIEGLDIGLRWNSNTGNAWKGAGTQWQSDQPVQIINREMEAAAAAAGFDQSQSRGYQELGADYVKYFGVGPGVPETHKNLVGTDVLTNSGAAKQASKLSGDIMNMKFYQDVSKIEELYNLVKMTLEKGAVHGGEYDHATIVKFMRTMDDSIVTESEVETIERNAGFKDRMGNLLAKFGTGATLTPTQRGIIATIMEEVMIGLKKRKLQDANAWMDVQIDNFWGPKQQPINPISKDMIASWARRWEEGDVVPIDVPHKPPRGGGEHTSQDTSGVSVEDVKSGVITVEDITDVSTGQSIYKKPVETSGSAGQPTAARPKEIPLSQTGIFDLSKTPVLQWEDNLRAVLNAIAPSLSPGDPMIKDLQEAIRKVRAMTGRP